MRLIDADALLDKCEHYGKRATWDNPYGNGGVYGVSYEDIEEAPTIDPEKHGHWEMYGTAYQCSVCKEGDAFGLTPYCRWCGAKMDEGAVE